MRKMKMKRRRRRCFVTTMMFVCLFGRWLVTWEITIRMEVCKRRRVMVVLAGKSMVMNERRE
jgi:hypothetical protein